MTWKSNTRIRYHAIIRLQHTSFANYQAIPIIQIQLRRDKWIDNMAIFTADETENIVKTWAVLAPQLEKYGTGLFIK